MRLNPLPGLLLGGAILLASLANSLFGIIRSVDYLRVNTPHFFAFITSPTAEIGIPIFGLALVSVGLYEIWNLKRHKPSPLHKAPTDREAGLQSPTAPPLGNPTDAPALMVRYSRTEDARQKLTFLVDKGDRSARNIEVGPMISKDNSGAVFRHALETSRGCPLVRRK